jgi:hypothetical protein
MPRLNVQVRWLPEACLWGWEIYDSRDGTLVESSWQTAWVAFATQAEAEAAGRRRLAELGRGGWARRRAPARRAS